MSKLTERTNEADIAAVDEVVLAYYDGMLAGDEVKLARAFHPRACVVGNYQGELEWQTFEEFVAECKEAAGDATGAYGWRIDGLSFQGDTALVRRPMRSTSSMPARRFAANRASGDVRKTCQRLLRGPTSFAAEPRPGEELRELERLGDTATVRHQDATEAAGPLELP